MRYPFVLFDVGGTLLGPRDSFGSVYARALGPLGLDLAAEQAERSLRRTLADMEREIPAGRDRYAHFPGGEEEYWLRFVDRTLEHATGNRVARPRVAQAVVLLREAFRAREVWQVFPDVPPALDALRASGARLAVVSNWDSRLGHVLEMLGLRPYFETLGVSHLEGVEKPDPELFRRVLARLGARPEAALHVGDVPELDLVGARAAGVRAVLVDRRGAYPGTAGALADLSALPALARGG